MSNFYLEIIVLLYAIFLSALHLFYERLFSPLEPFHNILLSYGAGSLLAVIFLILLPEAVHLTPTVVVYPLILLGYVVFLLSERYLYQHVKEPEILEKELYHLHASGFFIDYFIKGFLLVTIIDLEPILGFLIAVPFLIHTLSSSIALKQLHQISRRTLDKVLLSSSPALGTLAGILIEISPGIERSIVAFVSGMMLFLVSRDILPKDKEGKSLVFLFGSFTIFIIWLSLQFLTK